ncbi:extracellular calcium-sensing receptor-like [Triplophysa rosa]|uniref:Extracellular calcium-sensing receptor n=1 Tax=Triplophysa rosa TaxID=992332 RepID=A0A9W7WK45_TRIRA|nr:extracellular calcium-sensing receptor-like [Triplophysa rosa]KAI7802366.1 putative extracellular calcium-sensing receptor [Triplophysa rosa]
MARLSATLLTFCLLLSIGVHSQSQSKDKCTYQGDEDTLSFYQGGDVVLGGLFPLHFSPVSSDLSFRTKPKPTEYKFFTPRALRWMQTMIFAVEEINQQQDLLPNLSLGYHIRDSCDDIPVSVKRSLLLVNGQPERGREGQDCQDTQKQPSPVIVGDAASGISMTVLRTLGSFKIPLVSYFASCSCLSNKREFPAFMRTMPSDVFQIKALVKLVHYFQWTWVGVIGVYFDYARFAIQLFLKESERFNICPAYVHFYPVALVQDAVKELVDILKSSSATVILNFSGESEMHSILKECRRQNVTHLQWIASEAWATSQVLWEDFCDFLKGTLGFAIRRADIPNLGSYLKTVNVPVAQTFHFLSDFWEETFHCRIKGSLNTHVHGEDAQNWPPCNGSESLDDVYTTYSDVSQLRVSYNVYKAVYLIAHALHVMSTCIPGKGPFQNGTCGSLNPILPWQLLYYMKRTNFRTLGEEVRFDDNGDPIASYDLMNWQRGSDGSLQLVKLGFYDASLEEDKDLIIDEPIINWHRGEKAPESLCSKSCLPGSRKARQKGKPICCFDCIPCADGEISNQTDSIDCLTCSKETWPNQAQDQCIPKTLEFLSFQEPLGIVLWSVSALGAFTTLAVLGVFIKYRKTPVIRGNNMELSLLLLLFLSACFLISLTFIGKPTDWLCRIRYPAFGISFALCISCILAKTVVVLMAFRATLPGSDVMKWFGPAQQRSSVILCTCVQALICIIWLTTKPPFASHNTKFMSATLIVECTVGSEVGFWCVLGYIGFLACLCFLLAFLARKLPDNFNEAKFITFSMLIFFAVWITFIPVYVSTRGKYTVAVHVFAILASAFGLLLCIFAPKCYIVLLKPEKNDKKNMMKK